MKRCSNLSPCPFCGGGVIRVNGYGGLNFFKCQNTLCGAVMSFDNDYCNERPAAAIAAYNRRVDGGRFERILCAACVALLAVAIIGLVTSCKASDPDQQAPASDPVSENVSHETICTENDAERGAALPSAQPQLYTDADAIALAQMAWGECRGVKELQTDGGAVSGTCQKAAVMWCALNRYDAGFAGSVVDVVAAPMQFVGYDPEHPIDDELLALAYDVLERWEQEQLYGGEVGRVLPVDYLYFTGDGAHNHFRKDYESSKFYEWDLLDMYEEW